MQRLHYKVIYQECLLNEHIHWCRSWEAKGSQRNKRWGKIWNLTYRNIVQAAWKQTGGIVRQRVLHDVAEHEKFGGAKCVGMYLYAFPTGWQEASVGDDVQGETRHSEGPWDWKSSTKNCHQVSMHFFKRLYLTFSGARVIPDSSVYLSAQGSGAAVQRCEETPENNRRHSKGSRRVREEEGQASFVCLEERFHWCSEKDWGRQSHQQYWKGHCMFTDGLLLSLLLYNTYRKLIDGLVFLLILMSLLWSWRMFSMK